MELAWTKFGIWWNGFFTLLPNLIVALVVFALFVGLAFLLGRMTRHSLKRRGREDLGEMLSDFAVWATVLFGLLIALTIVLPTLNPGDLVAGLGVGSVAIGFAFKDILQNWLAGLLILLRQPFRRGDQISVGQIEGTVLRINQRATLIKTYDARVVVVPNADIYTQSIMVHTAYEHRRISLDVTVGYENDVRAVQELILTALTGIDDVQKQPPPQVLPWDLGPTSLAIKVRFWIESRRSSEVAARARVVQAIKEAFQASDIDPADPQIVYTNRSAPQGDVARSDRAARRADRGGGRQQPSPPARVLSRDDDPEGEYPREDKSATML